MSASLTISEAVELVRKNLDELEPNGSVMYEDEDNSNSSLDDIIARHLPEAINAVHKAAPVHLLEGKSASLAGVAVPDDESRVLTINTEGQAGVILRLVAFRAVDSEHVVSIATPEASVEGRKQLNPYIRGTYDNPVLVRCQSDKNKWMYYSLKDNTENGPSAVGVFQVIYEQKYNESAESYDISPLLRQNIIDYLTALTMETYVDQRAQGFFTRANQFES